MGKVQKGIFVLMKAKWNNVEVQKVGEAGSAALAKLSPAIVVPEVDDFSSPDVGSKVSSSFW